MAEVTDVSSTPNPDAMKFTVDRRFDDMFTVASAEDAESNPFAPGRAFERREPPTL